MAHGRAVVFNVLSGINEHKKKSKEEKIAKSYCNESLCTSAENLFFVAVEIDRIKSDEKFRLN